MKYKAPCFTDTNSVICKLKEIDIYESYWYRPSGGRLRPYCNPKRDQKNPQDPRGRPVTDNIDSMGSFLFCNAGFLQTRPLGEYLKLGHIPSGVCPFSLSTHLSAYLSSYTMKEQPNQEEMYMQTTFERLGITYRQEGDYLLPNIEAPESPQIGFGVSDGFNICEQTKKFCT